MSQQSVRILMSATPEGKASGYTGLSGEGVDLNVSPATSDIRTEIDCCSFRDNCIFEGVIAGMAIVSDAISAETTLK
jgi:hypothetical protein